jgi:integrase
LWSKCGQDQLVNDLRQACKPVLTCGFTECLRQDSNLRVLKAGAERAGLGDRHITWLTLRHTAASLMFDAGLTIFEVQQRVGHKSPTMTAEVYTHLMRERFNEGRNRMETYMTDQRQ